MASPRRPATAPARAAATLLLATPLLVLSACGKRGDPLPPFNKTPQPVRNLRLAQRGDELEIRLLAPQASVDGLQLPVLEIELWRSDVDDVDVQKHATLRAAPGESVLATEPLPPPGTTVRYAARARAGRTLSPYTKVIGLTVQEPPEVPEDFSAELLEAGVRLTWTPPPLPDWLTRPPTPEDEVEPAAGTTTEPPEDVAAPPDQQAPPPGDESPSANSGPPPATPTTQEAAARQPGSSATQDTPDDAAEPEAAGPASAPADEGDQPAPEPTPEPFRGGVSVYRRSLLTAYSDPVSPKPLTEPSFIDAGAPMGEEFCYVVRTVIATSPWVESASSDEQCVMVRDITAPAAPRGVAALLVGGAIEVSWSPSGEPDLAGYLVDRGERGEEPTLLARVPADQTVYREPIPVGARVLRYTIRATDTAGNTSPPSSPAQVRLP